MKFSDEDADDMNVDECQEDDLTTEPTMDSEPDEEVAPFETVCAICDNGGELICCEGGCFRSFHATEESEDAASNYCISLGLLPSEVEKGEEPFWCENCFYKRHQCFVCGELGSSDKSWVTEVFRCSSENCGHFYHPRCVATLLKKYGEAEPNLQQKIALGEPFICPAHKCLVCKQTESPKVKDLQFAVCRRCPTSYHRKCLPREIKFDDEVGDGDDDELPRAWDDLLPKSRALIFCLRHEINEETGTPSRNLKFENIGGYSMWDKLAAIDFLHLALVIQGFKAFCSLALGYELTEDI